ncbi:MAG: biotin transporter BioY [Brevundimonas sp.]|uniref:biotin transporter BioY n=1 Tax=Brevundimonas sp. TaxID=1871086 RepID=UPI00391D5EB7
MTAPLRLAAVAAFALLMALCAQVAVPMVPVPMTLQTFAVLLAGAVLGRGWGAAAVLLYLAMAALGLPVLADGAAGLEPFTGPTAGYLAAFPLAALVAGELSRRLDRRPAAQVAVMIGAHLLILVVGAAWLARAIGVGDALAHGFTPFLFGAAVESVAVVGCAALLRRLPVFRS